MSARRVTPSRVFMGTPYCTMTSPVGFGACAGEWKGATAKMKRKRAKNMSREFLICESLLRPRECETATADDHYFPFQFHAQARRSVCPRLCTKRRQPALPANF